MGSAPSAGRLRTMTTQQDKVASGGEEVSARDSHTLHEFEISVVGLPRLPTRKNCYAVVGCRFGT